MFQSDKAISKSRQFKIDAFFPLLKILPGITFASHSLHFYPFHSLASPLGETEYSRETALQSIPKMLSETSKLIKTEDNVSLLVFQ